MLKLADRLRGLRGTESQTAFAARFGLKQAIYSHYETGRKKPSLEVLVDMAMKLGATTDYLLGLSDEPPAKAGTNINGSFNIIGNHNTIAPPPPSRQHLHHHQHLKKERRRNETRSGRPRGTRERSARPNHGRGCCGSTANRLLQNKDKGTRSRCVHFRPCALCGQRRSILRRHCRQGLTAKHCAGIPDEDAYDRRGASANRRANA